MPTVHPQIVRALEVMAKLDLKPIEAMSPAEARQQMEETARSRRVNGCREQELFASLSKAPPLIRVIRARRVREIRVVFCCCFLNLCL